MEDMGLEMLKNFRGKAKLDILCGDECKNVVHVLWECPAR